jgi:hypothetical protein
MTAAEAVMLCRFAKACCPQQAIDEYTPDAWHELLSDLRFEDCKAAVVDVVRDQPFVSPAEIRARIAKVRANRRIEFGPFTPPPELGDDPAAESQWVREMTRRICDGELTREQWDEEQRAKGLIGNREAPELEGVFQRVSEESA